MAWRSSGQPLSSSSPSRCRSCVTSLAAMASSSALSVASLGALGKALGVGVGAGTTGVGDTVVALGRWR